MAIAFLVFLVTSFDVDLEATWTNLRQSNPWWYVLGLLVYYLSFLVRGWRWHLLLGNVQARSEDGGEVPSPLTCSQFILLGWFANAVAWFRLGDAYRAYLVAEASSTSFSRTFGTVVAERVMDVALVFFVLLGAVLVVSARSDLGSAGLFVAVAFSLVLAAVTALLLMWRFGLRLARLLPARLGQVYGRFQQGTLGSFQRLPLLMALGLLGWACEVGRLYLVVQALGFSLSLPMVMFVALANALLTTVPVTPGGLGIVEPGIVGLLRLRLGSPEAVSTALLDRSISYASIVLLGGALFLGREVQKRRQAGASSGQGR